MHNLKNYIWLLPFLTSCSEQNHNRVFYKTFDIHTMQGLERLAEEPEKGPYVSTESNGDTVVLSAYFPDCEAQQQTWIRKDGYWHSSQIKHDEAKSSDLKIENHTYVIDRYIVGDTIINYLETLDDAGQKHESSKLSIVVGDTTLICETSKKLAPTRKINRAFLLKIKSGCHTILQSKFIGDSVKEYTQFLCRDSLIESRKFAYFIGKTPPFYYRENPNCISAEFSK